MSEPTPTDEWTRQKVEGFLYCGCLYKGWSTKLAKAINAALAAEQKAGQDLMQLHKDAVLVANRLREELEEARELLKDGLDCKAGIWAATNAFLAKTGGKTKLDFPLGGDFE